MPKNILIFSDGTGQAGGLMPDETRSNIYKLFRATRCGPDSAIDPARQLAFYDPGLGSKADSGGSKLGRLGRWIYNTLSQATGLGLTRNIIDCYVAIVRLWEPGDRIYLFGFSRGAYTVRCLGGVLKLCGVPTRMADGTPLKRDGCSAKAVAKEAVKQIYQFGSSLKGDPYKKERLELGRRFRAAYGSARPDAAGTADPEKSNAVPYFIGVWDTVAALGASRIRIALLALVGVLVLAALAWMLHGILSLSFVARLFAPPVAWHFFWGFAGTVLAVGAITYVATHLKVARGLDEPWYKTIHLTGWKMKFYDTELDPDVGFARHALSIDENRKDFDRVVWTDHGAKRIDPDDEGPDWLQQIWFAGNHSDVGGSYAESEARLSDIALDWIVHQATKLPEPILVDPSYLKLWPSTAGPQHDERKAFVASLPGWILWCLLRNWDRNELGWIEGHRRIDHDAPLHPSVLERLKGPPVLHYDDTLPYRPEPLRNHDKVKQYY